MSANDRQHGGAHYKRGTILQHWDVCAIWGVDYFTAAATKYLLRWRDKNGVEDVEKAVHYTEKRKEMTDLGIVIKCGVVPSEVIQLLGRQHGLAHDEIYVLHEVFRQGPTALDLLRDYLANIRTDARSEPAETSTPGTPEDGGHHARMDAAEPGCALAQLEDDDKGALRKLGWRGAVRVLDLGGCVRRESWPEGTWLKSEGIGNWVRMSKMGVLNNRWSPESGDVSATDWVKWGD